MEREDTFITILEGIQSLVFADQGHDDGLGSLGQNYGQYSYGVRADALGCR